MFKKLAKLKYLPNNFEIIEDGDHVICSVSGKKIRVVSFGEERPIKNASNEKAWAENRRVEISLY